MRWLGGIPVMLLVLLMNINRILAMNRCTWGHLVLRHAFSHPRINMLYMRRVVGLCCLVCIIPQSGIIKGTTRVCQFNTLSVHLFKTSGDVVDYMLLASFFIPQHGDDTFYLLPHLLRAHRGKPNTPPASGYLEEEYRSEGDHGGDVEGNTDKRISNVVVIKNNGKHGEGGIDCYVGMLLAE